MNKTRIIGVVVALILLCLGLVGVMAFNDNEAKDMTSQQESSQGLSDDEIRDGLINHGVDHKDGEH